MSIHWIILCWAAVIGQAHADGECNHIQPPVWYKGYRHIQSYTKNPSVAAQIARCYGTTVFKAQQRDAYLDRMQERVLEIALPKVRKENLRQVACRLLLDPVNDNNEDVHIMTTTQECFKARFEQNNGIFTTDNEISQARSDCMRCSGPDGQSVVRALTTFRNREAKALDLSAKIEAGMRYLLDEDDLLADHEAARMRCGVRPRNYEQLLLDGDLAAKQKVDACTFRNSIRGRWFVAKQKMIRESAQEVARGLQDRPHLLRDLKLVFAMHLNNSALEKYIDCTAHDLELVIRGPFNDGTIQVDCSVAGPSSSQDTSAGGNSCVTAALQARFAEQVEAMVDDVFNDKKRENSAFVDFAKLVGQRKQQKKSIDACVKRSLAGQQPQQARRQSAGPVLRPQATQVRQAQIGVRPKVVKPMAAGARPYGGMRPQMG